MSRYPKDQRRDDQDGERDDFETLREFRADSTEDRPWEDWSEFDAALNRIQRTIEQQQARIEELEAIVRELAQGGAESYDSMLLLVERARQALNPSTKGEGE